MYNSALEALLELAVDRHEAYCKSRCHQIIVHPMMKATYSFEEGELVSIAMSHKVC